MGGKNSTTTTKTELPPEIVKAYEGLIGQATPISQTAYQPYNGGVNGSGFEQNQVTGFNNIANLAGSSNGAFNASANALASTATPTSATVGQYMSPYISNVVNATMANMNEQNAEQQQGVLGNAAAQGALGGNRVGVAQAELARQQNLANQQTIAGLYNSGYNTALSAAQADKAAQLQAGSEYANLGQTAMQTNLAQAAAQVGAGTQQQQWNYQQYQNALSYPFETTSWLANIVEGLGSGMGGTTTSQQPSGNTGSAILGGGLSLLAALPWASGGVVHGDDRPRRAAGGIIPYSNPSGIVPANNNNPMAMNDNVGYVPQVATAGITPGKPNFPQAPQGGQQQDQGQQMLQQGIKSAEQSLQKKYPNGILAGMNTPTAPTPAPTPAVPPTAGQSSGLLSAIGSALGFADGGVARRGYDDGGYVDPTVIANPVVPDPATVDPATISPTQMRGVLDAATPAPTPVTNVPADVAAANAAGGVMPIGAQGQGVAGSAAPPLAAPVNVQDHPIAGVVAPKASPSHVNLPVNGASQGIYDSFMNTVRTGITNPYGLAAVASTGSAESGFSPSNTYRSWSDPDQSGGGGQAGGIMSWRNERLSAMRKFVANNGGDPSRPSPQLQAQFFLQEDPSLVNALNQAKSPAEAQQLMNNAWKFAGYNRPGGEAGRRIAMANRIAPQFEATSDGSVANGDASQPVPTIDNTSTASTGVAATPAVATAHPGTNAGVSFSSDQPSTGVLGRLFGGHGLGLTDDQRMALLSAGLGMMAGTSPNFATNVGTGGLKGVESYMAKQALNRENANTQSEIATRAGNLNLEGKRVDLAGQELALRAKQAASEIGLQTAQTAKTNLETQTGRYQQTVTPAGIIVRDMTDPTAPPKLTTWDDIQKNGPPSVVTGSNEAVGSSVASGASQADNSAPPQQQSNAPVKAAPTVPIGAPDQTQRQPPQTQAQQTFVTKAPDRVPVDGRLFSPSGQGIVSAETTDGLKEARQQYQGATSAQVQLEEMKHDMSTIDNSAWTTPGTGFQSRVAWAKTINTAFQGLGVEPPIDEKAVAAGEDLNKLSTRLGFDLSSTLGSREAASVVDQAVSAVPGGYNSKEGAQRIIAGIEAANMRKIDYYRFLQDWSAKSGGSILGADDYFNKANPPEKYANAALLNIAVTPTSQADIDNAPKGTMFNIDGKLMVK